MNNHTLYKDLNVYFENEHYQNITDSIDEILILAHLKNYYIRKINNNKNQIAISFKNNYYKFTLTFHTKPDKTLLVMTFYHKILTEHTGKIHAPNNRNKIYSNTKTYLNTLKKLI